MVFVVFYSIKCENCNKLLKLINEEKLNNNCQLISFETNPDKIPSYILYIPAIISKSLSKPLFGQDAINWIKNKKYFNQITNNINKINVINPNIESQMDDLGYNKKESLSISDHYTNINDTNFTKSMLDYNKIHQSNIPIMHDSTNNLSIPVVNNLSQKKSIDELILLRKQQLISKITDFSKI